MRVLLIGSGGREHALALSLSADPSVTEIICAPGNPGIGKVARLEPVDLADPEQIGELAVKVSADLVVIGPEAPLVAGAGDAVRANGIACFGPSKAAAAIEGSKDFAHQVMTAAKVPTSASRTCRTTAEVEAALDEFGAPYVVKDDGLAAGKGVVVTDDRAQALAHAAVCGTVVIEEFLDGPEVSLFVIADGTTAVPMLPAQDFKRVGEGDTGLNTGGMGAYTPLEWAPADLTKTLMETVAQPTLAELARRGTPFTGVLYCGLALTADGPKVIEFNCRFGDPEIQALLALLESPLGELLNAAAHGELAGQPPLRWQDGSAVTVVIASQGYPEAPVTGRGITGADRPGVLHAGTALDESGALVSAGGRVLNCVGTGPKLSRARLAAYDLAKDISLEGSHYRPDIASAAVRLGRAQQ